MDVNSNSNRMMENTGKPSEWKNIKDETGPTKDLEDFNGSSDNGLQKTQSFINAILDNADDQENMKDELGPIKSIEDVQCSSDTTEQETHTLEDRFFDATMFVRSHNRSARVQHIIEEAKQRQLQNQERQQLESLQLAGKTKSSRRSSFQFISLDNLQRKVEWRKQGKGPRRESWPERIRLRLRYHLMRRLRYPSLTIQSIIQSLFVVGCVILCWLFGPDALILLAFLFFIRSWYLSLVNH